jgi:hypothetical protein
MSVKYSLPKVVGFCRFPHSASISSAARLAVYFGFTVRGWHEIRAREIHVRGAAVMSIVDRGRRAANYDYPERGRHAIRSTATAACGLVGARALTLSASPTANNSFIFI